MLISNFRNKRYFHEEGDLKKKASIVNVLYKTVSVRLTDEILEDIVE